MPEPVLDLTARPDVEEAIHALLDIAESVVSATGVSRNSFEAGWALGACIDPEIVNILVQAHGEEAVRLAVEALKQVHQQGVSLTMLSDGRLFAT